MRDLSELRFARGQGPIPFRPDDALIARVERQWGIKLPEDYVLFLKMCNGGRPQQDTIPPGYCVDTFFPVAEEDPRISTLQACKESLSWCLAPKDVPIAADGVGGYYMLDCSKEPAPVIWFQIRPGGNCLTIANSFGEFIDLLEEGSGEEEKPLDR